MRPITSFCKKKNKNKRQTTGAHQANRDGPLRQCQWKHVIRPSVRSTAHALARSRLQICIAKSVFFNLVFTVFLFY